MKRLVLSTLAMLMAASGSVSQAQPVSQSQPVPMRLAHNGDLSPEQLEKLEAINALIVLPMALPIGFTPVEVTAEIIPGVVGGGPSYSIRYQHYHNGQCFFLDASSGGFGGPMPENRRPLRSPLNTPQPSDQLYWSDASPGEGPFPTPVVFSEWLQGNGDLFYRVASGMHFGTDCDRVSPKLATQVIESLDYINAPGVTQATHSSFDPQSLQGRDENQALREAESHGYRLIRASVGQIFLTNGQIDLMLMRNPQTGRIESVMSGEAASTLCDPATEAC